MHHEIKIEDAYYEAIVSGDKTFEIRYNDRGYQKGDTVSFSDSLGFDRYDDNKFIITYVCNFSQKENWVVFAIVKSLDVKELSNENT